MRAADGTEIRLGDAVEIGPGRRGIVVVSLDTDEYADGYPKAEWAYLARGLLVHTATAGLIHIPDAIEDIRLIARRP